jgi:hypothetical protein
MAAARTDARGTSSRRLSSRRLSGHGLHDEDTDDGFRTVYASFRPNKTCLNATGPNGTIEMGFAPDHQKLVDGYNKGEMFDWYADYQVAGGAKTQLSFPEDVYYRIEEMEAYCPHNNIMNDMLETDRCMVKCTVEGATGVVPGCEPGWADGLTEDSNALCLPRKMCEAACSKEEDCSSIDIHKDLNRCYLNGPYCATAGTELAMEEQDDDDDDRRKRKLAHTLEKRTIGSMEYDFWAKHISVNGDFTYDDGTCIHVEPATLFTVRARPKRCEVQCVLWSKQGLHCGGFIYDGMKKSCHFFFDEPCVKDNVTTSCDPDTGCYWAEDGSAITNFWPYYYDAETGPVDVEAAGFTAEGGLFEGYYYYEGLEYYYGFDLSANVTFGYNYETCDTICEMVVPAKGMYVAKYTPPAIVEVELETAGGDDMRFLAENFLLTSFISDDHSTRLQWKGGQSANCNGWVVSTNLVEMATKTVYMCENEDALIMKHPDKPEEFTSCIEAPDAGLCDTSELVGSLCRHSCDPVNFPGLHHYVFDIDKRTSALGGKVMYTDYSNCGDLDAPSVVNCTAVMVGDPARCYDELVKVVCAATCEDLGVSTGVVVNYREVDHNMFVKTLKSWPRGAEVDWKETPTMSYTRSVYLHPTHTMKGGTEVWEPCSTVGSLRNLTTKERLAYRPHRWLESCLGSVLSRKPSELPCLEKLLLLVGYGGHGKLRKR